MELYPFLSMCAYLLLLLPKLAYATDILDSSDFLSDNGSTLVSKNGTFKLGFFTPGASTNRYIGIWYGKIPVQTVVWVANRNQPINDSSGFLMLDRTSNLVLSKNRSAHFFWSSNSTIQAKNPLVQLLDTGNLVIRDGNSESYIWQSFDYPSDTLLPGMKFRWDTKTGLNRGLSSWKNWNDPSSADPTVLLEQYKYPDEDEVYYQYKPLHESMLIRQTVNQAPSNLQFYYWDETGQQWVLFWSVPNDVCKMYSYCGSDGHCVIDEIPTCQCFKGFSSRNQQNLYSGCVRNNGLNCSSGDGFVRFDDLKLPDTEITWLNRSMNLEECKEKCLQNCSCMAYANSDIRGKGSGCVLWFGGLKDMRSTRFGQSLYVRMSYLDIAEHKRSRKVVIFILASLIPITFLMLIIGCFIHKRRAKSQEDQDQDCMELPPLIELNEIVKATKNFSMDNKLGEGGFGPVYQGKLADGQEIAVKRLSKSSGQGLNELKNEVILIAKLQHRNLVKLLGCCIEGDESLLVYEFMPNKSLDFFIFDQTRSKQIDWSKRYKIICGIAKGLLYLHQDSRLRIIHRDLKASNVLLDTHMNPKISDFGLAKTVGGDQTEGSTNRVVGTYGYMAPEYATKGLFSIKSDVFSFGVVMMEIISGKRIRGFSQPDHSHNLIGYAWILWKEGRYSEIVDSTLKESCHVSQLMRCVHISLLCVQKNAEDRPSMEYVVLMLSSETVLPQPKKPGYFSDKGLSETESSFCRIEACSANEMTNSLLEPR